MNQSRWLMMAGVLLVAVLGPGCSSSDSSGSGGSSGSGTGGNGTGGSGTGGSATGGTGGGATGGAAGTGTGGGNTGGAAGSTGTGGTGGITGSGSCATVGAKLHAENTTLACSSDDSASVQSGCEALYANNKCITEWEAMANCAMSQPESNWECNSSGHADVKSPFCDAQRTALKACTG